MTASFKIQKPWQLWEVLPWGHIGDAIGAFETSEEAEARHRELPADVVAIIIDQRRIHNFWKLSLGASTYQHLRDKRGS